MAGRSFNLPSFAAELVVGVIGVSDKHRLTCDVCNKLPSGYRIALHRQVRTSNVPDFIYCSEACFEQAFRGMLRGYDDKECEFVIRYFLGMIEKRKARVVAEALRDSR